jgi:hypothetical protein
MHPAHLITQLDITKGLHVRACLWGRRSQLQSGRRRRKRWRSHCVTLMLHGGAHSAAAAAVSAAAHPGGLGLTRTPLAVRALQRLHHPRAACASPAEGEARADGAGACEPLLVDGPRELGVAVALCAPVLPACQGSTHTR